MDEKPKKASLRGLGRQLMRGLAPKADEQTQKRDAESAYFEDDEALLNWMQPNTEEETPPVAAAQDVFEEPDFDEFFGETPPDDSTLILASKPAQAHSLDEIFVDPTPDFDEFFGDVVAVENPTRKLAAADESTLSDVPYTPLQQIQAPPEQPFEEESQIPDNYHTGLTDVLVWPQDTPEEEFEGELLPDPPEEVTDEPMDWSENPFAEENNAYLGSEPAMDDFSPEFDNAAALTEEMSEGLFSETDSLINEIPMPTETETFIDEDLPQEDLFTEEIPMPMDEAAFIEAQPEEEFMPPQARPPVDEAVLDNKLGGIPVWMATDTDEESVDELRVMPPRLEPLAPPVEDVLPAPLPTSERESAYGMGSPDAIHEGFLQPQAMDFETMAADSVVTRSVDFADEGSDYFEENEEAIPAAELAMPPVDLSNMKINRPAVVELTPPAPEFLSSEDTLHSPQADDIPLPEAEFEFEPPQEFAEDLEEEFLPEVLIPAPQEPEEIGGSEIEGMAELETVATGESPLRRTTTLNLTEENAQATDPFATANRQVRRPANEIFIPAAQVSDADLLRLFVDDARLRELFSQIEAMQEQVVANVRGERGNSDTYQEELLQASNLLLQSRENYDEARAILYRVRADLARERRVAEDITRYRPVITGVYVGMAIFFPILMLLGPLVEDITQDNGIAWFGESYYSMVAGYLGALLFGARTLYKHSVVERDFDSIHLYWYLTNPFWGFVTGFLAYLFIWLTVETSFSGNIQEVSGRTPLAMGLGAAVGYNQNIVTSILGSVQNRFAGGSSSSSQSQSK